MFDWTGGLNEVVTDITHQLSSRIPLSSKSLSSIESLAIIQSSLAPVKLELRVSPPYPVTMDPATRQASGIPLSARVFVQCRLVPPFSRSYGAYAAWAALRDAVLCFRRPQRASTLLVNAGPYRASGCE